MNIETEFNPLPAKPEVFDNLEACLSKQPSNKSPKWYMERKERTLQKTAALKKARHYVHACPRANKKIPA